MFATAPLDTGMMLAPVPVAAELLPVERNPYLLYLATLAAGVSRSTMACSLGKVAAKLGSSDPARLAWHVLRRPHMLALRAWLLTEYEPSSASKMLSGTRAILRHAWRLDLISDGEYERAIDLPPIRGERLPAGRALDRPELAALFRACGANAIGRRDAVLLALMYGCGLRRSEVVATDVEDLTSSVAGLAGSHGLVVRGKGDVHRNVYLPQGTARAVDAWLELRGREAGPLLLACTRVGIIAPRRRMGHHNVVERLKTLLARSGVAHCSPHDFRRSFVGDLLDAGADVATVQKLAGHRSPETTVRYDRRADRTRAAAADLLSVPFSG